MKFLAACLSSRKWDMAYDKSFQASRLRVRPKTDRERGLDLLPTSLSPRAKWIRNWNCERNVMLKA